MRCLVIYISKYVAILKLIYPKVDQLTGFYQYRTIIQCLETGKSLKMFCWQSGVFNIRHRGIINKIKRAKTVKYIIQIRILGQLTYSYSIYSYSITFLVQYGHIIKLTLHTDWFSSGFPNTVYIHILVRLFKSELDKII